MTKLLIARAIAIAATLIVPTVGQGQNPVPGDQGTLPAGSVILGLGQITPILQDLEKSIEFYTNLLKLTVPPPQAPGPRPFGNNPAILSVMGILQAQVRFVAARIPGSTMSVELEDFRDIDRKPVRPRPQDPGAVTLILLVRDINAAFTPLKRAGVPVVTPGGEPIAVGANSAARGVLITDPDGHFIELLQPDPVPETPAGSADSNIIGAQVRVTVGDTDQTMRVYRDVLQLPVQIGRFETSPLVNLMGLKGAKLRLTRAQVPGSALRLEFIEVKGVDRTSIRPRYQDPGAVRLTFRVRDIDSTVSKLKTTRSTVVSVGGVSASVGGGLQAIMMRDPNSLYLVFIQERS
jgi:catechol 2,3-dioxygenase-like lactoylglutathione lyase family enzyme